MQKFNTRKISFQILKEINENGQISDKVINDNLKSKGLDKRDENLIRKIVYGCLENEILLDYYIEKLSSMKFSKIDNEILIIIRIGLYQIIFLDKVPNSAAVNESVKLAKKVNFRSKGFVNGILRNYIRKEDELIIDDKDIDKYLSIKYSYPIWMIKYFVDLFGLDKTKEILEFNKKAPKLSVRVNTLKISRGELIEEFSKVDIKSRKSDLTKTGIFIDKLNNNRINELELFNEGNFYIQDDASILVAEILNPSENDKVLDVCAAPGGKSTHLAQIMNDNGSVISRDISNEKIGLIEENANRLRIKCIKTEVFDATNEDLLNINKFDKILVDAPCTGLGIIRRKPEIKLNRIKEDVEIISGLQYKILEESAKLLKINGELVYSTCSIGNIENINVINKFLNSNNKFKIVSIYGKDNLQLLPGDYESDGFFICKLCKILG
jgi:16S rRNA (cytosine967-C5)-methyltransferase